MPIVKSAGKKVVSEGLKRTNLHHKERKKRTTLKRPRLLQAAGDREKRKISHTRDIKKRGEIYVRTALVRPTQERKKLAGE